MTVNAAFVGILGLASVPPDTGANLNGNIGAPPTMAWERDLPGQRVAAASHTELGTPLIAGDKILVGSAGSNWLYVLNRYSGTLEHQYASAGPVQSAPVMHGNVVLFADAAGYTWAYEEGEQQPKWKHYGGAPIMSSPTLADGRVYVSNVGSVVYALDITDGSLIWRHMQEKDVHRKSRMELYGAPSPAIHGELLLAGFHDGSMVALTTDTGERQWQRRVGEGRYPDLLGAPLVAEQDAIVAGFSKPLMSLNMDTKNVRWRIEAGGTSAPIADGTWIVHGGSDGKLRSVDRLTGAPRWTWEAPSSGSLTQPVLTDAGVFVGSSTEGLYLIDSGTGEELWMFEPGYQTTGISANLAVDGRQIVMVTNAGRILSLVVPEAAANWAKDMGVLPKEGILE